MKKVFFVDDDVFVTQLYHHLLQAEGIQVCTANNGAKAIEWLHTEKPDLVVLDLHMPGIDGVDVLRFIRQNKRLKDLPVIVFSNGYIRELIAELGNLAVQKIIAKLQCTPKKLVKEIKELLIEEQSKAVEQAGSSGLDATIGYMAEVPKSELPRHLNLLSSSPCPQTRRKCLVHINKIMHSTFQRALAMGESLPCGQLTRALKTLLNDLYDHPDHVSEATMCTLTRGVKKLETLCAETSNPLNSEVALKDILSSLGD